MTVTPDRAGRALPIAFLSRDGEPFLLRPFRLSDIGTLARLIADPRFDYPFLTGVAPGHRLHPMARALDFALRIFVAEKLGTVLFGARRHWFGVIAAPGAGHLLGMVVIDEVVIHPPGSRNRLGEKFLLKRSAMRPGARVGDGELGIFVAPDCRRLGIGIAAIRAMLAMLGEAPSPAGGTILRRIWAETGAQNLAARATLERLGLVRVPALDRPAASSDRFSRNGTPLTLVHYRQPDGDLRSQGRC